MCSKALRRVVVSMLALLVFSGTLPVAGVAATPDGDDGLVGDDGPVDDDAVGTTNGSVDDAVSNATDAVGVEDGPVEEVANGTDAVGDAVENATDPAETVANATDAVPDATDTTGASNAAANPTAATADGTAPAAATDPSTVAASPANSSLPEGLCERPVERDQLPVEAIPGPADLPVEPYVPGVPTRLLTPEAVVGLVLGNVPGTCVLASPYDPPVDPSNPPTDPSYGTDRTVQPTGDRQELAGNGWVILQDGGPAAGVAGGPIATSEAVGGVQSVRVTDGRSEDYLATGGYVFATRDARSGDGKLTVTVVDRRAGGRMVCRDVDPASVGNASQPTDVCTVSPIGLPSMMGPDDVVALLTNPPVQETIERNVEQVPVANETTVPVVNGTVPA